MGRYRSDGRPKGTGGDCNRESEGLDAGEGYIRKKMCVRGEKNGKAVRLFHLADSQRYSLVLGLFFEESSDFFLIENEIFSSGKFGDLK